MTTKTRSKGATVYGREIIPQVGMIIKGDLWALATRLEPSACIDPITGYDGADFSIRLPYTGETRNVNVIITGRTYQRRDGSYWLRCRIVVPGDCEPDTEFSGWIRE